MRNNRPIFVLSTSIPWPILFIFLLLPLFLISFSSSLRAEQMNFVTTLSSPMGTFAQLETADPSSMTVVPLVNFCNTRASVGSVTVNGANAYLQTLTLKNGSTLGGNTPEFRISGILNNLSGGKVSGGRLMASGVTVENSPDPKSKVDNNLYLASGKVKGARTNNLTIPGKVQTGANAAGSSGTDLHWSNVYNRDYSCSGNSCSEAGSSYTTYLIKSKAASAPQVDCTDNSYKLSHKSECCPSRPQSDTDCWKTEYKWGWPTYEEWAGGGSGNTVTNCSSSYVGNGGLPSLASLLGNDWVCRLGVEAAGWNTFYSNSLYKFPFVRAFYGKVAATADGSIGKLDTNACNASTVNQYGLFLDGGAEVMPDGYSNARQVHFVGVGAYYAQCEKGGVVKNGW